MKNNQNTKIIPKASLHSINKNDTEEQVAMLDKDDHIDEILVAAAKASASIRKPLPEEALTAGVSPDGEGGVSSLPTASKLRTT